MSLIFRYRMTKLFLFKKSKEIGDRENESSYENRDEVRGYVNSS